MSKPLLLSIGNGKVQELVGGTNNYVPVWNESMQEWQAAPSPGGGGGGSGTVTSVGLTSGTSGIVIGGSTSPITTSGTFNLDAPQRFAFDTASPTAPTAAGQMAWNAAEGSLQTMMVGDNVDAIVGQQLYQRVVNNDTVTLTKGMVVYVDGSSGTRVTARRAVGNSDLTSATILGVVAESIAQNAEGFVITNGLLKDLSVLPSTSFTDGLPVYLSPTTAGGLTQTKPVAPQHLVLVGYCAKASNGAAGILLVHPQNGYELSELHDVYVNNPTSGQILVYDATSGQTRWENASLGAGDGIIVTPGAGSLSVALDSAYAPTFLGLALSGLSANQFVKTDASKNLVSQQYVSMSSEVTGTLGATNGGTAQSTWATGDMLYASGANTLAKRTIGDAGNVLTVVGGVPTWSAPATNGTVTSVSTVTTGMGLTMAVTDPSGAATITLAGTLSSAKGGTGTDLSAASGIVAVLNGGFSARDIGNGDIATDAGIARSKLATGNAYRVVVNNDSGVMTEVASTGSAGQVLVSGGASALPTWANAATGTVTSVSSSTSISGLSLTTTSGTPTPSITLSGTVGVAGGGTGATSLTQYGVLVGNGASAIAATSAGSANQYLKSGAGSANPSFATIQASEVNGISGVYAPLDSPAFINTPTAPTASANTNSTQIATTAYADTAAANAKNAPYDLSGDAYGALASGQTIFRFIAPRAITLTAISSAGGAAVQASIAGTPVSAYPQNVTAGQLISVATTSAGTDAYFTITGKVT